MRFISLTIFSSLLLLGCKVDPPVLPPPQGLHQEIPNGWPDPVYKFENNTITEDKFILGRELFYETQLSKDNTISCGSCHQGFVAFANADHRVSHGINDLQGKRNAPALFNLAWHPVMMHDGAINHIEVQPLGPINNPIEMGETTANVIEKLKASEKYRALFKKAFGDDEISSERMLKAIAQFQGLMLSNNSKFDRYRRGESQLTDQEQRGYNTFAQKCSSCHAEPLFSDFKYRNNGLVPDPKFQDGGRGAIKPEEPEHLYCFKTPSLRNIAKTGPYMHDGRYNSLEECLDHYTNNVKNKVNLDPLLKDGIALTADEKKDIIVFLHTLTDFEFLNNQNFQDPNFK